jgi:1-hydroxycarotenoid 3,4-desaturase
VPKDRVVVIGAGIGGLSAALDLAARGFEVDVVERAAGPGGKMRSVAVDGAAIDAGPTVMTMRWAFDALFARAGLDLDAFVQLTPLSILARHFWPDGAQLDLFADLDASAEAIGVFAGAQDKAGFIRFHADAQRMFKTLHTTFLAAPRPSMTELAARVGFGRILDLAALSPFETMWARLKTYFKDPRLRQLFGRYATYCGSSPFAAPATLMLIAHVEQDGVWSVDGGMHNLARALERAAIAKGARFHYQAHVDEIVIDRRRAAGVTTIDGRFFAADAIVFNGDRNALRGGLLGAAAADASPGPAVATSLSALTWLIRAQIDDAPLARHNVYFSSDYPREFADIAAGRLPSDPTIYVCAQDRDDAPHQPDADRLLVLVNAPAIGAAGPLNSTEIDQCATRTFQRLNRSGLRLRNPTLELATPETFEMLVPGSKGALYGMASHGWDAPFRRPGARTRVPGLYLAGGSVHPGAGVPMASLSGQLAAQTMMADRASTRASSRAAMPGGTSTRSARAAPTG